MIISFGQYLKLSISPFCPLLTTHLVEILLCYKTVYEKLILKNLRPMWYSLCKNSNIESKLICLVFESVLYKICFGKYLIIFGCGKYCI